MRLKKEDIKTIKDAAKKYFGKDAVAYLFGSRTDNRKKGGDIDIYVETILLDDIFERKIKMLVFLKKILGDQRIDLVVNNFQKEKTIFKVAKQEGVLL